MSTRALRAPRSKVPRELEGRGVWRRECLERGESLASAAGKRDHLLALVALERFPQCGGGFVVPAGGFEHFCQIEEGVALPPRRIGRPHQVDRLAGEALRFGVVAAMCREERGDLAPVRVFARELASLPGKGFRFVVASERAERATAIEEIGREETCLAVLGSVLGGKAETLGSSFVVTGDSFHVRDHHVRVPALLAELA